MTKEKILKLIPGPECDELIAKEIMGWAKNGQYFIDGNNVTKTIESTSFGSFMPSTDISAAIQVIDVMKNKGLQFGIAMDKNKSSVGLFNVTGDLLEELKGDSNSLPELICKISLLALLGGY